MKLHKNKYFRKIFKKESDGRVRHIYIFSKKVFSYKRRYSKVRQLLIRIEKKLSMPDSLWRIHNIVFYVPKYPLDVIQKAIVDDNQFFEQDILQELDNYIPENAIILDIGANIGNHTLYWAIKKNAKKIFAFEPITETFAILQKNIELNKIQNKVALFNIGLSDEKTSAAIQTFCMANTGATSINKNGTGNIELDYLDNINLGVDTIDLVKIDIEGHEEYALRGMAETLKKFKPKIFIEIFPRKFTAVNELLISMGYVLEKVFEHENFLYTNGA